MRGIVTAIRSESEDFVRSTRLRSRLQRAVLVPLLSMGILAAIGCTYFGSPSILWAFVQGESLVVTPLQHVLQCAKPGDASTVSFTVWNLTRKPLTLVGASSGCTCTATPGLPIRIPGLA